MIRRNSAHTFLLVATLAGAGCAEDALDTDAAKSNGGGDAQAAYARPSGPAYGYQVHLGQTGTQHFEPVQPGSDPERGRALFGIAADLQTQDTSEALFEGHSEYAGADIVSNGRACFTCHRGTDVNFGLAPPPMSESVPADDPLFTGVHADAQQDPDGESNLENLALFKYRPNRFNQARPADDAFRQVFFWRKSIALVNLAFAHGFLNDGRARAMFETDRGAILSHTQEGDARFDDIIARQDVLDLQAFQFTLVSDPRLLDLRDPAAPLHDILLSDPFYTVTLSTNSERRGRDVFRRNCMSCHSAPNVFNNADSVEVIGTDGVDPEEPVFGPSVGRNFNVGVSERNRHGLRFTRPLPGGGFAQVVLPLAREDGSIDMHTVRFDIGLAATTGRAVDVGRFKVPQLRNVRNLAPYFHDNSAFTLEEVVDYFNSRAYNTSADGRRYPIRLNARERADLLAFLYAL